METEEQWIWNHCTTETVKAWSTKVIVKDIIYQNNSHVCLVHIIFDFFIEFSIEQNKMNHVVKQKYIFPIIFIYTQYMSSIYSYWTFLQMEKSLLEWNEIFLYSSNYKHTHHHRQKQPLQSVNNSSYNLLWGRLWICEGTK